MGTTRCEGLACWRFSVDLHKLAVAIAATEPARIDGDFCDRICRAAEAPPRRIEEAFDNYPTNFRRSLGRALVTLGRAKKELQRGRQRGYVTIHDYEVGLSLVRQAIATTRGLRATIPDPLRVSRA